MKISIPSLSLLLTALSSGSAERSMLNQQGTSYGTRGAAVPRVMLSVKSNDSDSSCVPHDAVLDRIQSFADAVPAISHAYFVNGGGAAGSASREGCQAAYDLATATLDVAYGYSEGLNVLFKPTYTARPHTFRPTVQGALSYFIGTECLNMVGSPEDQFPEGNGDGSLFQEYGFALNNVNGIGWAFSTEWDSNGFFFNDSCKTPIVMGQMCFLQADQTGKACVDKTFGFSEAEDGRVVLTTHHSSAMVSMEGSIAICQEDSERPCGMYLVEG